MTDKLDTASIRALKSKRSKCADVGNLDLSNVPESHEAIWLQWGDNGDDDTWCADNINDEDVPYIRADKVFALCDEVDRLRAENERLRAFIEDFASTDFEQVRPSSPPRHPADELDPVTDWLHVVTWQEDARAALAAQKGEPQ